MDEVAYSRELLQAKLLIELMSQAFQNELVLKGGLAMRAVLGSTRYTADIDLDAVMPASVSRIQGIVRRSIDPVRGKSRPSGRGTIARTCTNVEQWLIEARELQKEEGVRASSRNGREPNDGYSF